MHPLFATPRRIFLYLLAWLPIGVALALAMNLIEPRPVSTLVLFVGPLTLLYATAVTSTWWLLRGEPLDQIGSTALLGRLLLAGSATAAIWSIAGNISYGILARQKWAVVDLATRRKDLLLLFLAGLILYSLSAALHMIFLVSVRASDAERRALESQVSAREAELRALRSQLNPHFLFNSLNSIMALVGKSPEEARRMCEGLGDFLRRTLNLGARDRVKLEEELDLIRHYLEIESVRFGSRLAWRLDVAEGLGGVLVPPLLLQPLVENAVKHGVAARLEGGCVTIEGRREGEALHLVVTNPVEEETSPAAGEGVGLDNVRRRLRAIDPARTNLEIRLLPGRFEVHLLLPIDEGGPA